MKIRAALTALFLLVTPAVAANINNGGNFNYVNSQTLTSGTATSLTAGKAILSNTTAASVVVPTFTVNTSQGGYLTPKLMLWTNATSGWSGGQVQVDLWGYAPTFTNGDGGNYAVATGSANNGFLGSLTCTFGGVIGSANLGQAGDGAYAECVPNQGTVLVPTYATSFTFYWTLVSLSTLTKASGQTFQIYGGIIN